MADEGEAVEVRAQVEADAGWKRSTLEAGWGSTAVARRGELVDAADLPGFVATLSGERVGLATYAMAADELEVVTIQALVEGRGVGRALMHRLVRAAEDLGARRLWLVTTNDNVRAYGFYQRCGLDLVRLVVGGVERSRQVKPGIPEIGAGGIPLRHELEFELRLEG